MTKPKREETLKVGVLITPALDQALEIVAARSGMTKSQIVALALQRVPAIRKELGVV
jgi:hypothetical protein